jgi:hypothetical protein
MNVYFIDMHEDLVFKPKPGDLTQSVLPEPMRGTAKDDTESADHPKHKKKGRTFRTSLKKATSIRFFRQLFCRQAETATQKRFGLKPVAAANPSPESLEEILPGSTEVDESRSILKVKGENERDLETRRELYNGQGWQGKVLVRSSTQSAQFFCKYTWTYLTDVQKGKRPAKSSAPVQFEDYGCYLALCDIGRRLCLEDECIESIFFIQNNEEVVLASHTNALSTLLQHQPPFITINIIRVERTTAAKPDEMKGKFQCL